MKFSLLSFLTLAAIVISTVLITNGSNVNINNNNADIDNTIATQPSIQAETETASVIKQANIQTSRTVPSNILELDTFRFSSVDGAIKVDKHNHLIIDQDLRHWFDFYLSAIGEVDLQTIILLMQKEIRTLPSPGQEQAIEIMTQYLEYKHELAEYDQRELLTTAGNSDIEQLSHRLNWQMRLRRRYLSENVVEAFWKKDEIIDNYALRKLMIHSSDLADEDKQDQLSDLESSLPEELSTFKKKLYVASNLLKKEQALQYPNDPTELRNLRIQEVGIEATERLEAVDKQQQEWQLKLFAYRDEMQKLSQSDGVSAADKEALLQQYRQDNFNDKERLRLKAAIQLLSNAP